ncbi:thioesterase [Cystobacter fuscus]|uniref:Thioesterase n=1 Tax=Cystobacter fuscus TaxID=43 RepID=A0A250J9N0_9BACT|nr:alpha/beta fold hydrolase [Cystobacter fuscus]ATB40131.1 thioesterase [Cystobacter fuscus]
MIDKSPWLVGKAIPGEPRVRLYCFPHSGGLPGEYVRWGRELPGVQVYGICPPGRGARVAEAPLASMREFVDRFLAETDLTPPFVFFGHSLGSLTAFEVVRELAVQGRPLPNRLIVSAYAAPHLPRTASELHALPDASLAKAINERYGEIPPHVMADPELLALLLPTFRTDFTLLETYRYKPGPPLTVPLEVFGADRDAVSLEKLELWRDHTTSDFRLHRFAGGHFYFRENPRALIEVLGAVLGV